MIYITIVSVFFLGLLIGMLIVSNANLNKKVAYKDMISHIEKMYAAMIDLDPPNYIASEILLNGNKPTFTLALIRHKGLSPLEKIRELENELKQAYKTRNPDRVG